MTKKDDLQAVANPLDKYIFFEAQIGNDLYLREDELRLIEPPVEGCPAWRITYDQGEGPITLFVANDPIHLYGKPVAVAAPLDEEEPSAEE